MVKFINDLNNLYVKNFDWIKYKGYYDKPFNVMGLNIGFKLKFESQKDEILNYEIQNNRNMEW